MQLRYGLSDDRKRGGSAWGRSELFVYVECGLVLLAALEGKKRDRGQSRGTTGTDIIQMDRLGRETYDSQTDPRFGQVDKQRVLRPALRCLDFLQSEIGTILLEVNLDNESHTGNK